MIKTNYCYYLLAYEGDDTSFEKLVQWIHYARSDHKSHHKQGELITLRYDIMTETERQREVLRYIEEAILDQRMEIHMQNRKKGFTLAELLVVVAIVSILAAISIPIFTRQLETSREATDLANVRSAYAEVMAAVMIEDTENEVKVVKLKQKKEKWQSHDPVCSVQI